MSNNTREIAKEFSAKILQEVLKSGAFEQAGNRSESRRRILPAVDPAIIDTVASLAKAVESGITEMVARVAKQILSDDVGQEDEKSK